MSLFEFNGEKYKAASKHQKKWGHDLISELSFKGNETVLDLGCGDGFLTEQLSFCVPHGEVIGLDASSNMLKTASAIHRNNLTFVQMDINEIDFENTFDVIFSNAALHWVKDHEKLLKNAYRALKPHGKILWDFGGSGNCANFLSVIQKTIKKEPYAKYFKIFTFPWFLPTKLQYTEMISTVEFSAYTIQKINRDRYFPNASEMIQWINQPCIVPFIECLPKPFRESFRHEIIQEMLNQTAQPDGTYFETFRRIHVYAQK